MEKLERYRRIAREVLTEIADFKYSNPEMTHEAVFDETNGRYLVMAVGWETQVRRVHYCLVHVDIINEKIWIQRDNLQVSPQKPRVNRILAIPRCNRFRPAFHDSRPVWRFA